ncbi:MAG: hypothetical protein HY820_29110 [Acidobacteria bacterium]|nr:hypothetical protein [Acidobacteriota bacterium]
MRAFMSPVFRIVSVGLLLAGMAFLSGQGQKKDEPVRLPDGRSQTEEILKADHKQNLKDAADLVKMSEDLKAELEKNDRHVLSMGLVKKTEEIEKLAKRIRSRMKRY